MQLYLVKEMPSHTPRPFKSLRPIYRGGPLRTESDLYKHLQISKSDIDKFRSYDPDHRYKRIELPKKGGVRVVFSPNSITRDLQKRIKDRIFSRIQWPYYLFGSFKKDKYSSRDYVACANLHEGAKAALKLDIEAFFDNISSDLVREIYSKALGFHTAPVEILTEICTHKGCVVQGGITSSFLAQLCLYDIEPSLVALLNTKGLTYTRLIDDITVSTKECGSNLLELAQKNIEHQLMLKGLPINKQKSSIQIAGISNLLVHGLNIEHIPARYPQAEYKRVRANVKHIEDSNRFSLVYRRQYARCAGRISKLKRIKDNRSSLAHKGALALFKRIQRNSPLASTVDIEHATKAIEKTSLCFPRHSGKFWYKKKWGKARYHSIFIKNKGGVAGRNSYAAMRDALEKIKPT